MLKIFAYCVEDEQHKGTLHDFFHTSSSTHYLTDEYGMVVHQGDAESCIKRLEWFERHPLRYYDIRNQIARIEKRMRYESRY